MFVGCSEPQVVALRGTAQNSWTLPSCGHETSNQWSVRKTKLGAYGTFARVHEASGGLQQSMSNTRARLPGPQTNAKTAPEENHKKVNPKRTLKTQLPSCPGAHLSCLPVWNSGMGNSPKQPPKFLKPSPPEPHKALTV